MKLTKLLTRFELKVNCKNEMVKNTILSEIRANKEKTLFK